MHRLLISTLVFFFTLAVFGQVSINQVDSKGKKQGFWRKTDSLGKKIYEGKFVNGIPVDTFRYFFSNGNLKTISVMSANGKRAATVTFFLSGHRMANGNYLDEKRDSVWQFYSDITEKVVSEEFYVNGKIEGKSKIFFLEGNISEIYIYKNGTKEGLWEQYFQEGGIKARGHYQAGEKDGSFQYFFPSGLVRYSGKYVRGHMDGTWTISDEKGKIVKKEIYFMGKLLNPELPPKK